MSISSISTSRVDNDYTNYINPRASRYRALHIAFCVKFESAHSIDSQETDSGKNVVFRRDTETQDIKQKE